MIEMIVVHAPKQITVLFDERCSFCIQCMSWMRKQPSYIPLTFMGLHSARTKKEFGDVLSQYGTEQFVAVTDDGDIYVNTKARLLCLYALVHYRELSGRLSSEPLYSLVDRLFEYISIRRHSLSNLLQMDHRALRQLVVAEDCIDGACAIEKSGA